MKKIIKYKKVTKAPKGWEKTIGATTAPDTHEWYNNRRSRFSRKRKILLVKKKGDKERLVRQIRTKKMLVTPQYTPVSKKDNDLFKDIIISHAKFDTVSDLVRGNSLSASTLAAKELIARGISDISMNKLIAANKLYHLLQVYDLDIVKYRGSNITPDDILNLKRSDEKALTTPYISSIFLKFIGDLPQNSKARKDADLMEKLYIDYAR